MEQRLLLSANLYDPADTKGPNEVKDQIRTQLASSVVAVISQVLLKKKGGGRIAAFETRHGMRIFDKTAQGYRVTGKVEGALIWTRPAAD